MKTTDKIEPVNIETNKESKMLNLSKHFSSQEKEKFLALLHEFSDVFTWSYSDLKGFSPYMTSHSIPLKSEANPVKKIQRPLSPALGATIREKLDKHLVAHFIFPIQYPNWVANLVLVRNKNGQIHVCRFQISQ